MQTFSHCLLPDELRTGHHDRFNVRRNFVAFGDTSRLTQVPIATPVAVSRYESPALLLFEAEP